jgi:hypothetical protein
VLHSGPSFLSLDTLYESGGNIPEAFLRGCGLKDWEIEAAKLYNRDLSNEQIADSLYKLHSFRAHQAIQIGPLFISYSHIDSAFVDYSAPQNQDQKSVKLRWSRLLVFVLADRPLPAFDTLTIDAIAPRYRT